MAFHFTCKRFKTFSKCLAVARWQQQFLGRYWDSGTMCLALVSYIYFLQISHSRRQCTPKPPLGTLPWPMSYLEIRWFSHSLLSIYYEVLRECSPYRVRWFASQTHCPISTSESLVFLCLSLLTWRVTSFIHYSRAQIFVNNSVLSS